MFADDKDLIPIRNDPRFSELQAMIKWTEPYQAGLQNEKAGHMEAAIKKFTRAIEINPQYGRLHNRRGLILFRTGKFKQARDDFAKFVELRPKEALAWSNLAATHKELNEFDKAIENATTAIELDSKYAPAFRLRAQSYVPLKKWEKAIADYDRIIELEPNEASNHFDRGLAYLLKGDNDKAQADFDIYLAPFDEQVQGNPENWENLNRRGVAKTKIERWQQAINDFNRALELAPQEFVLRRTSRIAIANWEIGNRPLVIWQKLWNLVTRTG